MFRNSKRGAEGFTLIEVLLAVALVAMLGSVLVMNINSLLRDGELETLEREYWRAVESARSGAVFNQQVHFLEWDGKEQRFLVRSAGETEAFEVDTSSMGDVEIEVFFEEVAPENSYVLIAGELVAKREIATVGFYPDGTCSPYTVSMKIAGFETNFQMDPWTGVQLVDPNEDEAGI
ncbi:prepilin-type N-terminal cleavage/methylation domain-containing protein [Pelagicoccus mobilis]|uniref:Prepilin-type N-terminal cleavage/methylation domain-containing protein n=1 Tax=Pelagicoccus mobilis TaxID=415221 RepID=A0A934S020_9BACT|nr:prepilin-type N-terminal cleavage/methylation domain-containing protein [Pelagicoccus mobilis]MBK1878056.1 prepilin-type N-terminal cleavage/methylation domain-containing protein [Pelagicoccus mobilis]